MPTVASIAASLATLAEGAAEWDPVGLQLGDPAATTSKIAVCHEVTDAVVRRVTEESVGFLVAYHPLLFAPTTHLVAGSSPSGRAHRLIGSGCALMVVHTAWDVAAGGTADALAGALGLVDVTPLAETPLDVPIGRLGVVATTSLADLARNAATALGFPGVRTTGDPTATVEQVAVVPGSGSHLAVRAREMGADVLVTADVSHHRAVAAVDSGLAVIDVGHAPSERPGMASLVMAVSELLGTPALDFTDMNTNPWETP